MGFLRGYIGSIGIMEKKMEATIMGLYLLLLGGRRAFQALVLPLAKNEPVS